MSGPFADEAPGYWNAGFSVIPIERQTKQPSKSLLKWSRYCRELPDLTTRDIWLSKYRTHGLGLCLGTQLTPEFRIGGVDIDDDTMVAVVGAILGPCSSAKRGKKGCTYFVRVPFSDPLRSAKVTNHKNAGVIDILIDGRMTLLPPTEHPETGQPYVWLGRPLLETEPGSLPILDRRKFDLIKLVIGSEQCSYLAAGTSTHEPGLRLTAKLVRFGCDDEVISKIVKALLPAEYKGNSLEELSGWIESARKKGFDKKFQPFCQYQPGHQGPIPLGFTRDGQFAFRDQVRNLIIVASANQLLSLQYLLGLAPSDFWAGQFISPKSMFNSLAAGETLIALCKQAGPFSPLRVRGRGIWREGDQIIINLGEPTPAGLKQIYLCFEPISFEQGEPFDTPRLLTYLQRFQWRNPQDAMLLLGWLALAPICGVLDWRPH